jgi:hypothetical protein
MRRFSMPERDAWYKLRPRNDREWHQIRVLSSYLAFLALFLAAVFFFKHRHVEDIEQNWNNATAIVEDVRPQLAAQVESQRGGGMLYQVEVLVKYKAHGVDRERWITVQQQLEPLAEAQLQAFRWKGKQCIVRWKPTDPSNVIAELS